MRRNGGGSSSCSRVGGDGDAFFIPLTVMNLFSPMVTQ
jgi:hypothetical protein